MYIIVAKSSGEGGKLAKRGMALGEIFCVGMHGIRPMVPGNNRRMRRTPGRRAEMRLLASVTIEAAAVRGRVSFLGRRRRPLLSAIVPAAEKALRQIVPSRRWLAAVQEAAFDLA